MTNLRDEWDGDFFRVDPWQRAIVMNAKEKIRNE